MSLSKWFRRLISKWISRIQIYEVYPLDTFTKLSEPIIEQLKKVPRMEILERPYSCVGDGNEFYYVQTAKKRLGDRVHLVVSWRLQDDGWTPYTVITVSKCIHFNSDSRSGIGVISIESIYPMGIPSLIDTIYQVENHTEELYQAR